MLKWCKSNSGIPYVVENRVKFSLYCSLDGSFRWVVFSMDFGRKTAIHSQIYLRTGKVFPLGLEFKFSKGITKHFTKEEQRLVYNVRKWIKAKPVRTMKDIKWKN